VADILFGSFTIKLFIKRWGKMHDFSNNLSECHPNRPPLVGCGPQD